MCKDNDFFRKNANNLQKIQLIHKKKDELANFLLQIL